MVAPLSCVIFEGVFAINFTRSNVLFFLLLRKQDDKMYALFPSLQLGQVLPRMAPQLLFFSSPGVIFQGGTKPSTVMSDYFLHTNIYGFVTT
jgi:hypothetical protein